MTLPTVDLPGKWRWKDEHYVNDSRRLVLQRKARLFWHDYASSLYFPEKGVAARPEVARSIAAAASRKWNTYKGTEFFDA